MTRWRHFTLVLASLSMVAFAAPVRTDDAFEQDLSGMQGLWERREEGDDPGEVRRVTKEVKGNQETLTFYGEGDRVLHRHRNPFKLGRAGDARVWTYSDVEVLEGPQKGHKGRAAFTYIYRLDQDSFYEAAGLLLVNEQYPNVKPAILTWKRIKQKD